MYDGSEPVDNRTLPPAFLWTAETRPQEGQVIHGPGSRVIHIAPQPPPASMWSIHSIHRPYDDDET